MIGGTSIIWIVRREFKNISLRFSCQKVKKCQNLRQTVVEKKIFFEYFLNFAFEFKESYYFCTRNRDICYLVNVVKLSHGVTGNTSDFGSEESRFEP